MKEVAHKEWARTQLFVSYDGEGWYMVTVYTWGSTADLALQAAKDATEFYARDRECFIRVEPEVVSETEFDTQIARHTGISRFAYRDVKGNRRPMDEVHHYPDFTGFAHA